MLVGTVLLLLLFVLKAAAAGPTEEKADTSGVSSKRTVMWYSFSPGGGEFTVNMPVPVRFDRVKNESLPVQQYSAMHHRHSYSISIPLARTNLIRSIICGEGMGDGAALKKWLSAVRTG